MGLSSEDRSFIEKTIDHTKKSIKNDSLEFHLPKVKQALQIENSQDFVFGMAYGEILQAFSDNFVMHHNRIATKDEINELNEVIMRRLKEIREVIFFGK